MTNRLGSVRYSNSGATVTTERLDPDTNSYYPCIDDGTGHIRRRLSERPMTFVKAEQYLINNHQYSWRKCMAIPQPMNHPYFSEDQEVLMDIIKYGR